LFKFSFLKIESFNIQKKKRLNCSYKQETHKKKREKKEKKGKTRQNIENKKEKPKTRKKTIIMHITNIR